MSHQYKSKYDQLRENSQSTSLIDGLEKNEGGHVRNICFIMKDGSQQFLNYAYLISAHINTDKSTVIIHFTSHEVCLEGYALLGIFHELMLNRIRLIETIDVRYMSSEKNDIVLKISISSK